MRTLVTSSDQSVFLAKSPNARFVKEDNGSLTIFSLFLFILILFISGMAVDLMRYENERVGIQNAIDTAIVAGSSLTQNADTDAEVIALVKEYVAKSGYDPDMVNVTPTIEIPAGGTVATTRAVSASVDFRLDTMFMRSTFKSGSKRTSGTTGASARGRKTSATQERCIH